MVDICGDTQLFKKKKILRGDFTDSLSVRLKKSGPQIQNADEGPVFKDKLTSLLWPLMFNLW